MKKCHTIEEIVQYIIRKHPTIRDKRPGGGVHGVKLLRKASGKRLVIEEIENFRIFDWTTFDDNMLTIDTIATGYAFRGNKEIQQTARLFLHKLMVINVYDCAAEFLSAEAIDFAYTLQTREAHAQHLYEWLDDKPALLRAQWIDENNEIARELEVMAGGLYLSELIDDGRNFDMDYDF